MSEPIKIGNVNYVKTAKGWVDAKSKAPASAELVKLLESIGEKNPAPAQILPKSLDDSPKISFKPLDTVENKSNEILKSLTDNIKELSKGIEKLTKGLSSKDSTTTPQKQLVKSDTPTYANRLANEYKRLRSEDPSLSADKALKTARGNLTREEIRQNFMGTKDEYGRVKDPGVIRRLTIAASPILAGTIFAARDKQREGIAQQTEKFEKDLIAKNPKMSKDELDKAVQEKRSFIEKIEAKKTGITKLKALFEPSDEKISPATQQAQEAADEKINKEQYGAKEDAKPLEIKLIDIADTVVSKLADAIVKALGGATDRTADAEKPESTESRDRDTSQRRSTRGGKNKSGGNRLKTAEGELVAEGGMATEGALVAEGALAAAPELALGAGALAAAPELALGAGALAAGSGLAAAAAPLAAEGALAVGGGLGSAAPIAAAAPLAAEGALAAGSGLAAAAAPLALAGLVGAGGAAATHFATEKIKKSGHKKLGAAADIGGSAATGAATGALIGSVIPGVGTAIGGVAGGLIGGGIGLWNERDELFGKKPTPVMQKGPSLQTQALNQASKQNTIAKSQGAPVVVGGSTSNNPTNIVNNYGSTGGELPTAGKRGSLDIKTFA